MADYEPCAGSPVTLTATADTTGQNTGNYTAAFTTGVLGTTPAIWEWVHALIDTQTGAPFASCVCSIRRNILKPVSVTYPAGVTEYSPPVPLQFRNGDELYFFFDLASSSTPAPRVTIDLRYDTALTVNRGYS